MAAEPRTSRGLWLRLDRKGSGIVSVSRNEAVDVALCRGWIDGQQDKYDEASWLVRFTPRKRLSRWSQINRARALELIEAGRVQPAGLAEIEAARLDGRWDAAYAPASTAEAPPDLQVAPMHRRARRHFLPRSRARSAMQFSTGSITLRGPRRGTGGLPDSPRCSNAERPFELAVLARVLDPSDAVRGDPKVVLKRPGEFE